MEARTEGGDGVRPRLWVKRSGSYLLLISADLLLHCDRDGVVHKYDGRGAALPDDDDDDHNDGSTAAAAAATPPAHGKGRGARGAADAWSSTGTPPAGARLPGASPHKAPAADAATRPLPPPGLSGAGADVRAPSPGGSMASHLALSDDTSDEGGGGVSRRRRGGGGGPPAAPVTAAGARAAVTRNAPPAAFTGVADGDAGPTPAAAAGGGYPYSRAHSEAPSPASPPLLPASGSGESGMSAAEQLAAVLGVHADSLPGDVLASLPHESLQAISTYLATQRERLAEMRALSPVSSIASLDAALLSPSGRGGRGGGGGGGGGGGPAPVVTELGGSSVDGDAARLTSPLASASGVPTTDVSRLPARGSAVGAYEPAPPAAPSAAPPAATAPASAVPLPPPAAPQSTVADYATRAGVGGVATYEWASAASKLFPHTNSRDAGWQSLVWGLADAMTDQRGAARGALPLGTAAVAASRLPAPATHGGGTPAAALLPSSLRRLRAAHATGVQASWLPSSTAPAAAAAPSPASRTPRVWDTAVMTSELDGMDAATLTAVLRRAPPSPAVPTSTTRAAAAHSWTLPPSASAGSHPAPLSAAAYPLASPSMAAGASPPAWQARGATPYRGATAAPVLASPPAPAAYRYGDTSAAALASPALARSALPRR